MCGVAGTLRLGMYATMSGGPHLLEIVKTFEARHPHCRVAIANTGMERNPLDWLRRDESDVVATRLPLSDPDVTIGPILSTEPRVLAVAADHPLAGRESVGLDDLADYSVSDVPAFSREMIDAFIPPVTPSGSRLRRVRRNLAELPVDIALGKGVHPTVPSFFEHYPHPGIVAVPMPELPPSQTALVWLSVSESARTRAFARAAGDVLAAAG
jgi:DNA-binding transcriptional LysR family regulator